MRECDFAFYSDAGGRRNNEDCYLMKKVKHGYLSLVADGLGGHEGGENASKAAVEAVNAYFYGREEPMIRQAVEAANRGVIEQQQQAHLAMKTTIALAYLTDQKVEIAHVGDTRVYAFQRGRIVFQTRDHSVSQLAVAAGEITLDGIREHADRNILTRALGVRDVVKTDITEIRGDGYDSLLLCSDGFWEYVLEQEMEETRATADSASAWLYQMRRLQLNRAPEACDNNTAIAIIK